MFLGIDAEAWGQKVNFMIDKIQYYLTFFIFFFFSLMKKLKYRNTSFDNVVKSELELRFVTLYLKYLPQNASLFLFFPRPFFFYSLLSQIWLVLIRWSYQLSDWKHPAGTSNKEMCTVWNPSRKFRWDYNQTSSLGTKSQAWGVITEESKSKWLTQMENFCY